ncbi:MAG: PIN domain-containing protein [Spirochaetaceae bacterium]|nr:PIN domain-containing protein [Spirochaetaceae bacterium]
MKVFLDTNILLDYLLKRQPFYDSVKKIFDMCLFKIDGCVTPHSLIDVYYMLSERTDATPDYCRETILKLRAVLYITSENDDRVLPLQETALLTILKIPCKMNLQYQQVLIT